MSSVGSQQDEFVDPATLHIDLANPRMPDSHFDTETDAIVHLADAADVSELVQSITTSGWFDYEPLIVLKDSMTVIEGNRRLAALRIMESEDLQAQTGVTVSGGGFGVPERVRVRMVPNKAAARSYIGFKHINGAFRWDSLAKARYAAEWLDEGEDIDKVSSQLGDNHSTILRLVNGWRVLEQAESAQLFDRSLREKRQFAFSHLYTALSRPNFRDYLGLPEPTSGLLPDNPVSQEKYPQLKTATSWLYGQPGEASIIRSQNPDLGKLVVVMGNSRALAALERTRRLDAAFDIAEDKAKKFSEVVYAVIEQLDEALLLSPHYDGNYEVRVTVSNIAKTARSINTVVREKSVEAPAVFDAD